MANYVIKELPTGMGNGSEGKQFPKMQVYTEFDYNKVVELVHTNSPAFSEATVRGVLDTLAVVMKSYLPMGHTMKIDNQQEEQGKKAQKKYHHVRVKGVNFKVDKKLVDDINKENTFERTPSTPTSPSPYTLEERLQRALSHIERHGFITLQEYANINGLNYSTASRELSKLVADPYSGIKAKGAGSHKVWVRSI